MSGRLPNFLIVGAQRSGSTSLWRYLKDHPEVFTASPKELHFFDRRWDQGLEWYAGRFTGSKAETARALGEATPRYMHDPVAVQRIAEAL
ncbi:MAG TPA: sulfotransferase, partial [Longimicrobiales bacterium]|nr:sulfotransferase [Longimicrobiales bacterium]